MPHEKMSREASAAHAIGKAVGIVEALRGTMVSDLDWEFDGDRAVWVAHGISGMYRAWTWGQNVHFLLPGEVQRHTFPNVPVEVAKAACGAHHRGAILSHLRIGGRKLGGIYVSSRPSHAEAWRDLRHFERMPIVSTWIDAGNDDLSDFSMPRVSGMAEIAPAAAFLLLRRSNEVMSVERYELALALRHGVPVFTVGLQSTPEGEDGRIRHFETIVQARRAIVELGIRNEAGRIERPSEVE